MATTSMASSGDGLAKSDRGCSSVDFGLGPLIGGWPKSGILV